MAQAFVTFLALWLIPVSFQANGFLEDSREPASRENHSPQLDLHSAWDELLKAHVSEEGWDSQMICYAYVYEHKGQKYMVYNGNGFGATGLGYAVLT